VAPQNEPNYRESYPSRQWKAADYDSFVGKYLEPALKSASLNTSVILGTMSRNDTNTETGETDQTVVTTVLGDSTSMSFVKDIGLQRNMLKKKAFIPSGVSFSSASKWQTEHKCGNHSWGGAANGQTYNSSTAPNDFPYAEESWGNIHEWLKAGVSVYSAWNMVLDPKGVSDQLAARNADCCGSRLEDPNFEARLPRVPTLFAVNQAGRYSGGTSVTSTAAATASANAMRALRRLRSRTPTEPTLW